MLTCQQASSITRWTVNLPNVTLMNAVSSRSGRVSFFMNDPGFGFELHVLPSSSSTDTYYELRVTAVEQLDGVTVECFASETFMSTIQIAVAPG